MRSLTAEVLGHGVPTLTDATHHDPCLPQVAGNMMFVSGLLQWNDQLRAGSRPQDIWLGAAEEEDAVRIAPPVEPWQHVVTVAALKPDQVQKYKGI